MISLYTILVLITLDYYVVQCRPKNDPKVDPSILDQYYCYKLKTCTSGSEKVCGFDEAIPHLAVFEDMCTLYKANCRGVGLYYPVKMMVCETRSSYDKAHANETFEYIHIITTPPSSPDTILPDFDHVIGSVIGVERLL